MEKNVAVDRQAALEMIRASGQQGVPVIAIDGEVVVGFDVPRLTRLLTRVGPRLGASVADASSQARSHPGIPSAGAYVGDVRPGSPAHRAGLRRGDVITALGGRPVLCAADLLRLVPEIPKGHDVPLSFVRQGQALEVQLRF